MKIKKINAESFGKLKNKTIELSDGINVIKGANESGKSSVARFVRFMLYGFTSRASEISKNDRKKYLPWDDSACKGSLEVSVGGKEYTVRREQSARASHSITDGTGVPVFKGISAGEAFLGVDEETFDKTALISAGDVYFDDAVSLSGAIKNMVFSADSSVDSENAVKKLEALRKSILGKTERSGRLFDARNEMKELTQRKSELADIHKELLGAETMLGKIKANIDKNNGIIDKLNREKVNIDAYKATLQLEKINLAKKNADESKERYEGKCMSLSIDGFLPDRKFLSDVNEELLALAQSESDIVSAQNKYHFAEENLKNCYKDTKQFAFNETLSKSGKSAQELKNDVDTLKGKLKSKKFAAIILTFLIITLPVAIVFWLGCSNIKKQLEQLIAEFGCGDVAEFECLLDNSGSSAVVAENAKRQREMAYDALQAALKKREQIAEKLCSMLDKSGCATSISDTSDLASAVKAHIRKLSFEISGLEAAEGQMNVDHTAYISLMKAVPDYEALCRLAESFTEDIPLRDAAQNAKELDFYTRATDGLMIQEREYEKKAAVISANIEQPDEITAKIAMLEKEIAELELKNSAVIMASEAIEKAHESMRGNVSPILTQNASKLFSKMTGGKYKGLYVDNELKLSFLEEGSAEYRNIDYLSSGAADAAYLALRITLVQYLYEEEPVLIFDDAFSRLDDERLANVCEMLKAISDKYQIIILTCHDREGALLKKNGQL